MSQNKFVHVAVGVVKDKHGQFLISKRAEDTHQGGLWEFPGGKLEQDETVLTALKRELNEELGINIIQATPLIRIHHDYIDKSVLLDVWTIDEFSGNASGQEGQKICWINENDFSLYEFPAANYSIIKAIQLPDKYLITGEFGNEYELMTRINNAIENGIKLIQFRAHQLAEKKYFEYAEKIYRLCSAEKSRLLLNTSIENYKIYNAVNFSDGLHLSSKEIHHLSSELDLSGLMISTSTHNEEELQQAKLYGVDLVVLSPVKKTLSHPEVDPLGWKKFNAMVDSTNIPVYALGGMTTNDISIVKSHGGQGIAAIREFWRD